MKRLFDIVFSGIAIIIASPILLIIMFILSITGEREVFFLQERIGLNGKPFKVFKFATMQKNSDKMPGGDVTVRGDPRVTKVGRILRKTKLNELPQIFNVFIGDMSIVGPRPLMKVHYEHYPPEIREKIYKVKPGITGIASVVLRDEEYFLTKAENKQKFMKEHLYPLKGNLEIWYQTNFSVLNDLVVIFLTAWVILFPKSQLPYKVYKDLPENNLESIFA
jgi:lipopolysaccharide/colanic/teichoic acid biosynthesis glycosyltransferase